MLSFQSRKTEWNVITMENKEGEQISVAWGKTKHNLGMLYLML